MEDDPTIDQVKLSQYIYEQTLKDYNELGSVYSLIDIIWEHLDEHIAKAEELAGVSIDELAKRYDVEMLNANLEPITEEEAQAYKPNFMTLESNYNLHGDILIYIYKERQKLSDKFGLFAFQA
jgi:N-dimethylarginine dimethylaminohydrolase